MKISVLVPTLGERKTEIDRLFKSLEGQEYKNFEVVVISQDNHDSIKKMIDRYSNLNTIHICINKKGLSHARNIGLKKCSGDIIVLSDDDCWYHKNSLKIIVSEFIKDPKIDVLLTQIYDAESERFYKKYPKKKKKLNKYHLLSKSSIEISFKKNSCNHLFDEDFGLGGLYPCAEEVDFLLNNYGRGGKYYYVPKVTVYHQAKDNFNDKSKFFAKGALYAKNFNIIVLLLVFLKDLFLKKQSNWRYLWKGYKSIKYKKNY